MKFKLGAETVSDLKERLKVLDTCTVALKIFDSLQPLQQRQISIFNNNRRGLRSLLNNEAPDISQGEKFAIASLTAYFLANMLGLYSMRGVNNESIYTQDTFKVIEDFFTHLKEQISSIKTKYASNMEAVFIADLILETISLFKNDIQSPGKNLSSVLLVSIFKNLVENLITTIDNKDDELFKNLLDLIDEFKEASDYDNTSVAERKNIKALCKQVISGFFNHSTAIASNRITSPPPTARAGFRGTRLSSDDASADKPQQPVAILPLNLEKRKLSSPVGSPQRVPGAPVGNASPTSTSPK